MTTGEFIKMLQEEDPSGTSHLRMCGGIPYAVEQKEGYYDGAYNYIDSEGNYITTTKGNKVDVYFKDPEDIIWDECDIWEEGNKERVLNMFKFDWHYTGEMDETRRNQARKSHEETYQNAYDFEKELFEKYLTYMLLEVERGLRCFEFIDIPTEERKHIYPRFEFIYPDGKTLNSCHSRIMVIYKSGRFHKITSKSKPGYYEWIFIK